MGGGDSTEFLTSLAADEISDITGVVAAAFADPPTATLKATDGSKNVSTKERKFEKSSSNENHWENLTSFN